MKHLLIDGGAWHTCTVLSTSSGSVWFQQLSEYGTFGTWVNIAKITVIKLEIIEYGETEPDEKDSFPGHWQTGA